MFDSFSCALLRATFLGLVAIAWTATTAPPILAEEENPAEAKIYLALRGKTEIEFLETPLQEVAEFLSDFHNITIRFDKPAFRDVGIGIDAPVTRRLKGVSLRSALRLMLRDLELTYTVENGVLLITTPEEAETRLTTRLYPVADLAKDDPETPYSPDNSYFDSLMVMIEATIAPDSWDANGGIGAIDGFDKAGALVVSQTQDVHEQIQPLLDLLHRLRGTPAELKAQQAREADRDKQVILRVYRVTNIQSLASGPSTDDAGKPRAQSLPPDYAAAKRSANALAGLIKKAVAPKDWGDRHTIRTIPGTLTIRQTRRVHGEIGRLLGKMHLIEGVTTLSPVVAMKPVPDDLPTTIRVGENAGEARIRKVLDEKTEFELLETPLSEFLEFLADKHKIEIQMDAVALADVGIGTDTPLTSNLKGIPLRSALRLVLRDVDLTFMVRDEVLTITTPEEAEVTLKTWIYPVKDLVVGEDDDFGVYGEIDFDPLSELIEATVMPDSWDANGGPGAIDGFENPCVLVLAQTEEVHRKVARLLEKLRQVRDAQFKRDDAKQDDTKKAAASQPVLRVYAVAIGVDRTVKTAPAAKAESNVGAGQLGGSIGGNAFWGTPRERALRRMNALPDDASAARAMHDLAALVKDNIEPASWQGDDAMIIDTMTGYLVVRHSVEVQRRIRVLLYQTGLWGHYGALSSAGRTGPPRDGGFGGGAGGGFF